MGGFFVLFVIILRFGSGLFGLEVGFDSVVFLFLQDLFGLGLVFHVLYVGLSNHGVVHLGLVFHDLFGLGLVLVGSAVGGHFDGRDYGLHSAHLGGTAGGFEGRVVAALLDAGCLAGETSQVV